MTDKEQTQLVLQKIREMADKDNTIFTLFSHTPLPKKDISNEISDENFDLYCNEIDFKSQKVKK